MIFKKEVLITYCADQAGEAERILKENSLHYQTKSMNRLTSASIGSLRSRIGNFGLKETVEYKIFVKADDYEFAKHLLRNLKP